MSVQMDTTSIYPYEYFLETQGIDVATGQRDLQNLFGQSSGRYLIELRSIRVGYDIGSGQMPLIYGFGKDRRCFYIRVNMDLSRVREFSVGDFSSLLTTYRT